MPFGCFFNLSYGAARNKVNASVPQRLSNMFAHIHIKSAQGQVSAIDQINLAAKCPKDTGKFKRDIAATINNNMVWTLVQIQRFVGGDSIFS